MVVIEKYSARLVDATSKQPLLEHVGPKGEIYAEAEPDTEYFIELQNNGGEELTAFHCFIDGKRVPNAVWILKGGRYIFGLMTQDSDGQDQKTAFRFRQPSAIVENKSLMPGQAMMGTVTVQVSEAVPWGSKPRRVFSQQVFPLPPPPASMTPAPSSAASSSALSSSLLPPPDTAAHTDAIELPFSMSKKQGKKVLRSVAGNFSEVRRPAKKTKVYEAPKQPPKRQVGDILQEININYCTALGLIYAGVLAKPPLWEEFRMKKRLQVGADHGGDNATVAVPSKTINIDAVYEGGVKIADAKKVEIFDLTD